MAINILIWVMIHQLGRQGLLSDTFVMCANIVFCCSIASTVIYDAVNTLKRK